MTRTILSMALWLACGGLLFAQGDNPANPNAVLNEPAAVTEPARDVDPDAVLKSEIEAGTRPIGSRLKTPQEQFWNSFFSQRFPSPTLGGFPESAIPGQRYVMSAAGIVAFSDDGKTVYAYSERHPRWAEQKLDSLDGIQPQPVVERAVIAVQHGSRCYAYSPLLGTWDTLRLPEEEAAEPVVSQDAVQVNSPTKGDYVFKPAWGKWFSAEEIKQGKVAEHLAALEQAGALKGTLSVKVFNLKHVDPNEIARLLNNLYDRTPDLTIAADVSRQSLLVRGPENILQEIEALLLRLDEAPPKKATRVVPYQPDPTVPQTGAASPSPGPSGRAINVVKVYKLQAATPEQFEDLLRNLVPDATVETDESKNSLIVSAPEAAFVNIDALIQQIDAQMEFMNTGKVTGDLSRWLDDSTRAELLNSWNRDNTIHTENLAAKLRKTPAPQRDPAEVETLKKMVRQLFTIRQSLHREELAEFERRVARMRESIDLREKIADRIVDRRVEELLDPNVNWEEIRSPEAAQPLVGGSRPGELPPPVSAGSSGKAPSPDTGSSIGLPGPPSIPRYVPPPADSTSSGDSREPGHGGSFDPALSGRYTLRVMNVTESDYLAQLQGKPAYLQLEGQLLTVHVPQEGGYQHLPMLLTSRRDINPVAVDVIVDPNGDSERSLGILSVESTPQEDVLRFCVRAIKSEAEIPESSRPMLFAPGSHVEYFEAVRPRAADYSNLPDLPGHQDPQAAETIWNSLGVRVRTAKAPPFQGEPFRGGLEVTEVRPGFPAESAKLQAGDIIIGVGDWRTINLNALVFALNQSLAEPSAVRVIFFRGQETLSTDFRWVKTDRSESTSSTRASTPIPAGMRVVRVTVDNVRHNDWPIETPYATDQPIKAGDRIDVLVTYLVQKQPDQPLRVSRTRTLMKSVRVFAVDAGDASAEGQPLKAKETIALLVTPEQAAALKVTENRATLSVSLSAEDAPPGESSIDRQTLEELQSAEWIFSHAVGSSDPYDLSSDEAPPTGTMIPNRPGDPNVPAPYSDWLNRLQGRWEVTMAHAEDGRTQTAILPGLIQQDQFTMSQTDGSEPTAFRIRIGTPAEPQPVDLIPLVSSAEAKELGDAPLPVFQGIIEPTADGFRICLDANGDKVRPIVFAAGPNTVTYHLRRPDGTTTAGSPTPPAKAVDGPEQPKR